MGCKSLFSLKIKNAKGDIFELTHDNRNYCVVGIQGLTPPATAVNISDGAGDGSYYNSSRVEKRNIVIDIILNGDIETNRQRLYKIFNLKKPCEIYFKNSNRNVKITGYVEIVDGDLFVEREQMQISIICPRPFFEDLNTIYTELSKILKMFEFPFEISNPIPFSEIVDYPLCTINNTGDVECGCILSINIFSAVEGLTVYNVTKQEFFALNYSFIAGDEIIINTVSGNLGVKVIRNGVEINLLNYVKMNSKWFQLEQGDNDFTYTTTSGADDAVYINFATAVLYGGV